MKVIIELTPDSLAHINEVIANNMPLLAMHKLMQDKAHYFLMDELSGKLLKKGIDKRGTKKKFNLSLKYFQAYALHKFLLDYIVHVDDESRRISREILGEINQKLT